MLDRTDRLALFCEGALGDYTGKMAHGLLMYSPNPVVCVVDSRHAGKDVRDVVPSRQACPVVASIEECLSLGAEVLVLGVATPGGFIPPDWFEALDKAVSRGMSLVNGLHQQLSERYRDLQPGQWIWDVRVEPEGLGIAVGEPLKLDNKRLLMVGTDMSIGKMTAGLEIFRTARERGIRAEFVATGQIGVVISGRGVALDAVRVDFASGAIEREVMACKDADLVIVEGQGSLVNPSSSANLALTRGSMPTHLAMCHKAGKETLRRFPWIKIPPLDQLMRLHQDLAEACGCFVRPEPAGICLNTAHLSAEEADRAVKETEDRYGWPCTDPVRFGAEPIVERLFGS